jgi:hypothetical protein
VFGKRLVGGVDQGCSAEKTVSCAGYGLQAEGDGWAPG